MLVARRISRPDLLNELMDAARSEGFRMLDRLADEWESGENRFDKDGEALFGAFLDGRLVGVGGLNRQSSAIGRVRRVYVLPEVRRSGVGRAVIEAIIGAARGRFEVLVLRTDSELAARFYQTLGFGAVPDASHRATHRMELR